MDYAFLKSRSNGGGLPILNSVEVSTNHFYLVTGNDSFYSYKCYQHCSRYLGTRRFFHFTVWGIERTISIMKVSFDDAYVLSQMRHD